MSIAGTNDLQSVYPAYQSLMGTGTADGYPFYLSRADEWLESRLNSFDMTPPPPNPNGTYDYLLRECCANIAVYMAANGILSEQQEVDEDAWWAKFEADAEAIISKLQSGDFRQRWQTSMWERGIGPAMPQTNGTIPAPQIRVCTSNHLITGQSYTGDMDRDILIELDGTGSTIAEQTFRWKERSGVAWEYEEQSCNAGTWCGLWYGIYVHWQEPESGTLEPGMQWLIPCHTLSRPADGPGIVGRSLKYGL